MARLGKREREAKRAIIRANEQALASGTFGARSSGALFSRLDAGLIQGRTHRGVSVGWNAKPEGTGPSRKARFSEPVNRNAPVVDDLGAKRNRHAEARIAARFPE